ncbi:hypothetical protein GCM10027059_45900 [Myceligenerans halotolerans]
MRSERTGGPAVIDMVSVRPGGRVTGSGISQVVSRLRPASRRRNRPPSRPGGVPVASTTWSASTVPPAVRSATPVRPADLAGADAVVQGDAAGAQAGAECGEHAQRVGLPLAGEAYGAEGAAGERRVLLPACGDVVPCAGEEYGVDVAHLFGCGGDGQVVAVLDGDVQVGEDAPESAEAGEVSGEVVAQHLVAVSCDVCDAGALQDGQFAGGAGVVVRAVRASSTTTFTPASASRLAVATPVRPAPTTDTSVRSGPGATTPGVPVPRGSGARRRGSSLVVCLLRAGGSGAGFSR